jgi:hypothetical protein
VARNREVDASETGEAPGWQGAEEGEYREYLTDERRSQAGCIDGRSGIESPVTGHYLSKSFGTGLTTANDGVPIATDIVWMRRLQ